MQLNSEIAQKTMAQAALMLRALGHKVEDVREMGYGLERKAIEQEMEVVLRATRARISNMLSQLGTKDADLDALLTSQFYMELDNQERRAARERRLRD